MLNESIRAKLEARAQARARAEPEEICCLMEAEQEEWNRDTMRGQVWPVKPPHLSGGNYWTYFESPEAYLAFKRDWRRQQAERTYEVNAPRVRSKLADRNSILADIGSRINLICEDTDREFRQQAEAERLTVKYEDIPRRPAMRSPSSLITRMGLDS